MNEKYRVIGSDMAKVDAYENTAEDYEEIPELTDEFFANAVRHVGGVPAPRGRPKSPARKKAVSLRLSPKVLNGFQEDGPGWQTRINDVLEEWLDRKKA